MPDLNEPTSQEPENKPNGPTPRPTVSPQIGRLRWVAIIGSGVIFLWRATSLSRMQPRQDWGIVVVIVAAVAVGFTCLVLMPLATRRLRRHLDLLLPFGLYIIAEALLNGLTAIPINVLSRYFAAFSRYRHGFVSSGIFRSQCWSASPPRSWASRNVLRRSLFPST